MATKDAVGKGVVTLANSKVIRNEAYSDTYYVTYSLSFTSGKTAAKTTARKHLDHYQYIWYYKNANGTWFTGSTGTTTSTKTTYTPPSNAVEIKVSVRAIAKQYTSGKSKVYYWTSNGYTTSAVKKIRDLLNAPSVSVELRDDVYADTPNLEYTPVRTLRVTTKVDTTNLLLTGTQNEAVNFNWKYTVMVFFKITNLDTKKVLGTPKRQVPEQFNPVLIDEFSNNIVGSIDIPSGAYIGVQARLVQGNAADLKAGNMTGQNVIYSEYGEQEVILTRPAAPIIKSAIPTEDYQSVLDDSIIRVDWDPVNTATSYTIYWAKDKDFFKWSEENVESKTSTTSYSLVTVSPGAAYWFRVKATNASGDSYYSTVFPNNNVGIIVGVPPAPPTTWSSTTTSIIGSDLFLYWVHNSKDGSSETEANLEIYKGDITDNKILLNKYIKNEQINDPEHKDDTKFYQVDTLALNALGDGLTSISWRVRTKGIINTYSDWSIVRKIDLFAPPTLELTFSQDPDGVNVDTITQFPFYLKGFTGPPTQVPIGYSVEIRALDAYSTINDIGEETYIAENQIIFNQFYDTNDLLDVIFTPDIIDLEPDKRYQLIATAAMNSGLSADNTKNPIIFTVDWNDSIYQPYAEITYNDGDYTTSIMPVCYPPGYTYVKVVETDNGWEQLEDEQLDLPIDYNSEYLETFMVEEETEERQWEVYYYPPKDVYFTQTVYDSNELITNVTLAVYRKNYDGTYTEISSGLPNDETVVIDPHPSLDYGRYRIVATDVNTGAISWYDNPPLEIQEKALIIQWDESWSNYIALEEGEELFEPTWAGSLLRLPFNIDISNSYSPDVNQIEYAGRSHPVTYYGTQTGESASWSADIAKVDSETLYQLRRLAVYMGDVYVREPYGSGYWANVQVSFSQTHREVITPVSLTVTRVDSKEL